MSAWLKFTARRRRSFCARATNATSVNDIANALGMTKAGLYHYINGKKELLFDIMNFGLDELEEEVGDPRARHR